MERSRPRLQLGTRQVLWLNTGYMHMLAGFREPKVAWFLYPQESWASACRVSVINLACVHIPGKRQNALPEKNQYKIDSTASERDYPWKRLSPFLIRTGRRGIQVEVRRPTNCFWALYETAVASRGENFKWKIFFFQKLFFLVSPLSNFANLNFTNIWALLHCCRGYLHYWFHF